MPPPLSGTRLAGDESSDKSGSIASKGSKPAELAVALEAATRAALSGRRRAGSTWKGRPKEKDVVDGGAAASATTSAGVAGKVNRSRSETTFAGPGAVPVGIAGEGG